MESDRNPLPEIDLFPRISRVVHFLFDHITSEGLSDHATGASEMLDRELYDQPEIPGGDWDSLRGV